jgi:hypothetical protein
MEKLHIGYWIADSALGWPKTRRQMPNLILYHRFAALSIVIFNKKIGKSLLLLPIDSHFYGIFVQIV